MRIRVVVQRTNGATGGDVRRGEPLTFGVPLPRGVARDEDAWTLGPAGRHGTPAQTRALDRWPDGSVRWMLVDGQADLDVASSVELELSSGGESLAPQHRLIVDETDTGILIDTGVARFRIKAEGGFPFHEVIVAGDTILDAGASELTILDEAGASCRAAIAHAAVEEAGPLRSSVVMTGTVARASNDEFLHLSARLHFFAGLATVRLLVTLTNPNRATHAGGFWDLGDPGSALVKEVSLRVRLAGDPAMIVCSPERGLPALSCAIPFELYQDSSGGENWMSTNHVNRRREVPNTFRGYRLRSGEVVQEGLRASPIIELRLGTQRIAVALPHFWQTFPKSVEVSGSLLTIGLFPRQYADLHEIQGGEQKTHECFLAFGDDVTQEPLGWCLAPAVASVDPAWSLATQAIPFLAPIDGVHRTLVDAAIDGQDSFERKREIIDEYGWRHFGEIYGDHEAVGHTGPIPLVSHCNNVFDPIAGFACHFVLTGDPGWWRMMRDLAAHVIDVDVYHTTRDRAAYNRGHFWHTYHYGDADKATHRTFPLSARGRCHGGGPSADSLYTTGLLLHYFLTGDAASRDTVIQAATYVIDIDDGAKSRFRWLDRADTGGATESAPGYYGPGRSAANSLDALLNGCRLSGETHFAEKADLLIKRVVHPHDDIGALRLDDPERRWFYTMFLQALARYLHRKEERGELDGMYAYARACLLHYARWMAAHEYPYLDKPERLEFPTETWAAHEARKSDVFYSAARHATADERERFCERGAFFFHAAIDTLAQMPTRTLARPVIVLMTSGLLHTWSREHPDSRAPAPEWVGDYGRPQPFVPQRARAIRRAVWLGSAALLAALLALQIERVAGLIKQFVPGSATFLLLALVTGTLTMLIWRPVRKQVLRALLSLTLVYVVLACPWTAHRLAAGLYGGSLNDQPESLHFEASDRAAVAVFAGDHGFARLDQAVRLYHELKPRWVIVSGGPDFRNALARAGVPGDRLLWDDHPVNTRSQAVNLRAIVDKHGIDEVLLVVSPLHMKRALGACLAAGIRVKPSPSARPHERLPMTGLASFVPSLEALRFSWEAIYEYMGLVYYYGRGWLSRHP